MYKGWPSLLKSPGKGTLISHGIFLFTKDFLQHHPEGVSSIVAYMYFMVLVGDLLDNTHGCSNTTSQPVFLFVFWHLWKCHLNEIEICFCAGILFSTLVFGPACGFILGSLCTKFYVDAIFIDTSEFHIPPVFFLRRFSVQALYWLLLPLPR